jgi:signal transduction histidine kinase/CheY-like chemotaxis protein
VTPSTFGETTAGSTLLAAALDASPDPIALVDGDGRLLGWNKALVDASGLLPETLTSATVDTIDAAFRSLGGDERVCGPGEQTGVSRGLVGAPESRLFERIEQLVDLAGPRKGRLICFRPLDAALDPSDEERQQLRAYAEQRRHALRMEAVGRLAGGIAHDFNNMLTVMIGFAEQLQSEVGERPALTQVVRAAQRAADLTRQLLAFSRQQVLRPQVVDVAAVVLGMGELVDRLIGDDVRLDIDAPDGLPSVSADPTQLEQIVLNLAINARDAMVRGGRLAIRVGRVSIDTPQPGRGVQPAGDYVRLVVSDTGSGIPADLLHKVFEPFFTTKGTRGTGLGLSTVYGIVKQSGGYVWIDSQVDAGTTFTIDLPTTTAAAETVRPVERTIASQTAPTGGCIVVVEDLAPVRELTREMLEADGFEVLEAASAQQALDIIEAAGERVNLVLSDVMMPEMTGRELATAIHGRRPGLPVLFMSGLPRALDSIEPGTFLAKPFTRTMLLSYVRARLAAAATAA